MEEPRLFEVRGAVIAIALSVFRNEDGLDVVLNSKREDDPLRWERETYSGLTWPELLDVLTATYLS